MEKHLNHIIKIIIVSGVIQIIGLLLIVLLSFHQQKNYKDIIDVEYQLSDDCDNIVQIAYYSERLISSYMLNYNNQEDYCYELEQAKKQSGIRIQSIQDIVESNNELAVDIGSMQDTYDKYLIEINNSITEIGQNNNVTEIYKRLEYVTQRLNNESSVLKMYLDTEKNGKYNMANTVQKIQNILYFLIILIALCSILMCIYIANKNGNEMAEIQEHAEKMALDSSKKAYTDQLTGLWNRAYITKAVGREIKQHSKGCLFEIDMDNFKKVNDIYGHIAGDNVLKAFAEAMKSSTRDNDICCRAGGDEYMLFCKDISEEQAHIVAKKIMEKAHQYLIKVDGGQEVTLSMGGCLLTDDISDFKMLYDKADMALYQIKENGKNGFYLCK